MREAAQGARIGDYELVRALPVGVAGVHEYDATHVLLPREAHVRVGDDAAAGKRLMREACILEALRHPGVPRIYECGLLPDRRPWVALELLDGPTLADAIVDRPLLVDEVLALLRDVAQILEHAHGRGIVHCRLRPERIVRQPTGLCITTWAGACTHDGAPQLEPADQQMYLAPELVLGGRFDGRADIYSLGVIAYEALALAAPTVPISHRLCGLPRPITALIDRMTSSTALARPTAAEVRAEAIALLAAAPLDDGAVVEEIELELTHDLSRQPPPIPSRALRWTPPYQPVSDRRR